MPSVSDDFLSSEAFPWYACRWKAANNCSHIRTPMWSNVLQGLIPSLQASVNLILSGYITIFHAHLLCQLLLSSARHKRITKTSCVPCLQCVIVVKLALKLAWCQWGSGSSCLNMISIFLNHILNLSKLIWSVGTSSLLTFSFLKQGARIWHLFTHTN